MNIKKLLFTLTLKGRIMKYNRIFLVLASCFTLLTPRAHAAAEDRVEAMVTLIKEFEATRTPETTGEQEADFHAEISKKMLLELSWKEIQQIRQAYRKPAYLSLFPNFGCEHYRQVFVNKVAPALIHATKFIIRADNDTLYTIYVETATEQHAYRYNVEHEWISIPSFVSRAKTSSLHDFMEFVAAKEEHWREAAMIWRAAQD